MRSIEERHGDAGHTIGYLDRGTSARERGRGSLEISKLKAVRWYSQEGRPTAADEHENCIRLLRTWCRKESAEGAIGQAAGYGGGIVPLSPTAPAVAVSCGV